MSTAVVGAGGVALVGLNLLTGPNRQTLSAGVLSADATPAQTHAAHSLIVRLGGALLFVAGAALLAGVSSTWDHALTALIVALFVLWAINRYGKGK